MKTKHIMIALFLLSILYLLLLPFMPTLAFIVLVTHFFVAAIIVLYSIPKHHSQRINWFFIALMPLMAIVTLLIPSLHPIVLTLKSILICLIVLSYFFYNVRKWYRTQLILDIAVLLIITLGMTSELLFTELNTAVFGTIDWLILSSILVSNEITIISVLVMIAASRAKIVHLRLYYIVIGIGFRIAHDILFVINIYTVNSVESIYTDILNLIAFSLFALGAIMEKPDSSITESFERKEDPLHFYKAKLMIIIGAVPLLMFIFGKINITHFAIILVAIIFYLLLTFYVQKTLVMERLIAQDQFLKDKLEAMVDDRTRDLKKANTALYNKSTRDDLTGLYNRAYFIKLMEEQINIKNNRFSIFYMDLDRFKIINDLHGHDMGDKVLALIAKKFNEGNCHKCSYARVGGDEFAILFKDDSPKSLEELSQYILNILAEPIIVDEYQFHVGISIGISRYPKEATTVKQLLKYADIAMYHAKTDEKIDKYVLYSSNLIKKIERRNAIELLLRDANFEKDFELYYQPKFETNTLKLIGMEALIRWHHKTEGFISPAEFIPIAEESGIILKLSDWIFATAMSRIKTINETYNKNLVMSINVSPLSLDSISFLPNLRNMLKKLQIDPQWVELEITEHSAMNTAARMEELFTAISGLGLLISIDDFGTGYSSLNYIKRFDIDILKIAKELIDNIETSNNDRLIVNAIVKMAQGMGLQTIAEGVETKAQLDILKTLECSAIQGFYLGRPVPAKEFEALYLK